MNPSGFYVDPKTSGVASRRRRSMAEPAGQARGNRASHTWIVNSHVDAKKKPPELLQVRRLQSKTAATYSPTVTQYHRRDKA